MKSIHFALTLTAAGLMTWPAIAEEPAAVVTVTREAIKEGRSAAHEKIETDWARTFRNAKFPYHWLGMTPMTGTNEVWFFNFYRSYADMEKSDHAVENSALKNESEMLDSRDGELRSGSKTIITEYRKSMSYRADQANMGKVRYGVLTIYHVKLGRYQDFREGNKLILAALEKSNYPYPMLCYSVVGGEKSGTIHTFMPLESLAALDTIDEHDKKFREALGAEQYSKLMKGSGDIFDSIESVYFKVSPNMSYVPAEVEAVDPAYWRPKSAPAAKPVSKPAPSKQGQ